MCQKISPKKQASNNLERLNFLNQIEKQQAFIKELLEQIESLQSLSQSLNNLFDNTNSLSPSIKKAFYLLDTLDDEQKTLSTAKVELRLEHLELKIRDEVSYYLELISSIDEQTNDLERIEKLQTLTSYSRISEFKRKVSLALAYRVLLFERDELPTEFNLDVAPELLGNALKRIDAKKSFLKTELTSQFSSLRDNVRNFAKKASTSKKMASALHKISDDIEANLLHLKSGKPSEELPASIFDIEENIKLVAETQPVDGESAIALSDEQTRKQAEVKEKKQGLFGRINVWINTPDSTTWKDTKKK